MINVDVLLRAASSIRNSAEALRDCHTINGDFGEDVQAAAVVDEENALAAELEAMAALQPAMSGAAPTGWKLVPIEPTSEQMRATMHNDCGGLVTPEYRRAIYRAMLEAAPASPQSDAAQPASSTPPPTQIDPEPVYALLRRSLHQLSAWQRKYGEHNPQWLPPAGDVRLAEDIDAMLNQVPASSSAPAVGGVELLKDAVRIDFLASPHISRYVEHEQGLCRVYEDRAAAGAPVAFWQAITPRFYPSAREAIDAALAAQGDGGTTA